MLLTDVLKTLLGTTYYTIGAVALVLGGGIVASTVRATRTRESHTINVPARRRVLDRYERERESPG